MFLIGLGETGVRILVLLLSIASIPLMYLASKEFFGKKAGILSALILSIYWVHIFFTGRVLTGLPSTAFFLAFWYFFAKGFIKNQGAKYRYFAVICFGIAFMFRVVYGMISLPIMAYLLLEEKFDLIKKKENWMALLILILTLSPIIIFLFTQYPADPIGEFLGFKHKRFSAESGAMGWAGVPKYILDIPYGLGGQFSLSQWIFLGLFIFGFLIYFSDLFLGFDQIFKSKKLRMKLFILGLMIFLFIVWGNTRAYVEQRDLLSMSVFLFGITSIGILNLKKILSRYNKQLAVVIIVVLFAIGAYYQVTWGFELTKIKADSPYNDVKYAGEWIKENSQPGDIVYSTARKQMLYYTELEVLDPGAKDYGSFVGSEKTKQEMITELETNKNIKFIEMDAVEIRTATSWLQEWIQQNPQKVQPLMAWYADPQGQQLMAVVYGINR